MRRRDVLVGFGGSAVALSGGSGCALLESLFGLKQPTAQVLKFRVTDWSLDTLGTLFDVAIDNPNGIGFNLQGIDYALGIEGKKLTSGRSTKQVGLKANDRSTTQLAFDFPLASTAQALISLLTKRSVNYDLDSTVKVGSERVNFDVPLKHNGSINLPRLPSLKDVKLRFDGLSGTNLRFGLSTGLNNSNAFALPIGGLLTNLNLNGRNVLRNRPTEATTLASSRDTEIVHNFEVPVVDLGMTLAEVWRKPSLNWDFDLGLKSGKLTLPFGQQGVLGL